MSNIIVDIISFATSYPLAMVLWAAAFFFMFMTVIWAYRRKTPSFIVVGLVMIVGIGFLIGGLIYDPAVAASFRVDPLAGIGALFSSYLLGVFLIPLALSAVMGFLVGKYRAY